MVKLIDKLMAHSNELLAEKQRIDIELEQTEKLYKQLVVKGHAKTMEGMCVQMVTHPVFDDLTDGPKKGPSRGRKSKVQTKRQLLESERTKIKNGKGRSKATNEQVMNLLSDKFSLDSAVGEMCDQFNYSTFGARAVLNRMRKLGLLQMVSRGKRNQSGYWAKVVESKPA